MKIYTLLPVSSIMSYLSLKKVMWACKREGLRIYNTVNMWTHLNLNIHKTIFQSVLLKSFHPLIEG